jgi:DNA segregation ATPase FtsK/SpoIIIE, S-DNA-T family
MSQLVKLPYVILVVDELADVMIWRGEKRGESKLAEGKLGKIVQKSRAAGIHVIAATQRPSVDIITGTIKSNFLGRLSFRLPSGTDSRVVLGTEGAEHLLSRGDMLYQSPLRPNLLRMHAPLTTNEDIRQSVEFAKMKQVSIRK